MVKEEKSAKKLLTPSQLKILVCCHKPCELPKSEYLLPVHVGAALSDLDLEMQRDDEVAGRSCDNISEKNPNYCELTAMYWAWKNIHVLYPDLEYIGLNHYRRYFAFRKKNPVHDVLYRPEHEAAEYVFNFIDCSKILNLGNIICAKRHIYPYPLAIHYASCHVSDDLRILCQVIHDISPSDEEPFLRTIINNNKFHRFNMFVMPIEEYESYCSWLFPILFKVEETLDISRYNSYQARVYGYMAERLLNVWLIKNEKKVSGLPVYVFSGNGKKQISTSRKLFRDMRSTISFNMNRPISDIENYY